MSNESGNNERGAADQIAARYAGKTRAVMRRASIAGMENGESIQRDKTQGQENRKPVTEADFCPNCEWVRIMNPEGVGWCQEHGDINDKR